MQKPAVTVMVKAARLAGNVLLRNINKLEALNVVEKGRMDYASEVDADAEKVIVKELKRAYPEYGIMAEEGGLQGVNRYMWVIDPLDGTSNYLRGFPHYCVSIALVENGEPIDAVIFDPLRNELFTASRAAGRVVRRMPQRPVEDDGAPAAACPGAALSARTFIVMCGATVRSPAHSCGAFHDPAFAAIPAVVGVAVARPVPFPPREPRSNFICGGKIRFIHRDGRSETEAFSPTPHHDDKGPITFYEGDDDGGNEIWHALVLRERSQYCAGRATAP